MGDTGGCHRARAHGAVRERSVWSGCSWHRRVSNERGGACWLQGQRAARVTDLSELFPRAPSFPTVRTSQYPPRQLYLTCLPIHRPFRGPPRPFPRTSATVKIAKFEHVSRASAAGAPGLLCSMLEPYLQLHIPNTPQPQAAAQLARAGGNASHCQSLSRLYGGSTLFTFF